MYDYDNSFVAVLEARTAISERDSLRERLRVGITTKKVVFYLLKYWKFLFRMQLRVD